MACLLNIFTFLQKKWGITPLLTQQTPKGCSSQKPRFADPWIEQKLRNSIVPEGVAFLIILSGATLSGTYFLFGIVSGGTPPVTEIATPLGLLLGQQLYYFNTNHPNHRKLSVESVGNNTFPFIKTGKNLEVSEK